MANESNQKIELKEIVNNQIVINLYQWHSYPTFMDSFGHSFLALLTPGAHSRAIIHYCYYLLWLIRQYLLTIYKSTIHIYTF